MPVANLKTLYAEIPAISAEESLAAVTVAQVGGGLMERRDSRRTLRDWQRLAGYTEQRRAASVDEQRQFAADFARAR